MTPPASHSFAAQVSLSSPVIDLVENTDSEVFLMLISRLMMGRLQVILMGIGAGFELAFFLFVAGLLSSFFPWWFQFFHLLVSLL